VGEYLTFQLITIYPSIVKNSSSGWIFDVPAHHHISSDGDDFMWWMKSWLFTSPHLSLVKIFCGGWIFDVPAHDYPGWKSWLSNSQPYQTVDMDLSLDLTKFQTDYPSLTVINLMSISCSHKFSVQTSSTQWKTNLSNNFNFIHLPSLSLINFQQDQTDLIVIVKSREVQY